MKPERLAELLSALPSVKVAIIGDYFLDKYSIIDPGLEEVSIETGLPAYQVVENRPSPGAAGSVTTKVAALGVGTTYAVTMLGDDGNGYELTRELAKFGVNFEHVVRRADRFTPTYGKPMVRAADGTETELNRMDVKNRVPLPAGAEAQIIASIEKLAGEVQAIIVLDQVEQPECGVVTARVRETICRTAGKRPELFVLADSRNRIGLFHDVMIKPNFTEAARALGRDTAGKNIDTALEMASTLARRNGKPVFITMGARGIVAADAGNARLVEAYKVDGPVDIVGAGDTVTAGVVSALCAGADIFEAAAIGNLAASITIKQLGTTGTATPEQMMQVLRNI